MASPATPSPTQAALAQTPPPPPLPRRRSPSLYWAEKLTSVLVILQVSGLLLRAVVWPAQWRITLRWAVLLNVDLERFAALGSISTGQGLSPLPVSATLATALLWASSPWLALLARHLFLRAAFKAQQPLAPARRRVDGLLLSLALPLHIPCTLAIAALYSLFLPAAPGRLPLASEAAAADVLDGDGIDGVPAGIFFIAGWRSDVLVLAILCLPSALVVTLLYPVALLRMAGAHILHASPRRHELALRRMEAEWAARVGDAWGEDAGWLVCSFRRGWGHPYTIGLWCLTAAALSWTAAVGGARPDAQGDVFFILMAAWSMWVGFTAAFRCRSTGWVAAPLLASVATTAFFGVMRAHEFRTELVVDTRLYESLVGINLAGAAASGTALCVAALGGGRWPRHLLSQRVETPVVALPTTPKGGKGGAQQQKTAAEADAAATLTLPEGEAEEGDDSLAALSLARLRHMLAVTATATAATARRGHQQQQQRGSATVHPAPDASTTAITITSTDAVLEATRRKMLFAIERAAPPHRKWGWSADGPASSSSSTSASTSTADAADADDSSSSTDPFITHSELARLEYDWIRAIRESRRVLATQLSPTRPLLMVDVALLADAARAVAPHFARAFACRHILALTLAEAVDSLCERIREAHGVSIANHPVLGPLLPGLRKRMDQRERDFCLTGPRGARVLTKLLAMRGFLGDRNIPPLYIPGVNDAVFLRKGGKGGAGGGGLGTSSSSASSTTAGGGAGLFFADETGRRESEGVDEDLLALLDGK
jgi:hypothetical protein